MSGPIKRWFGRLKQKADHGMNVVYASPSVEPYSMDTVYDSPEEIMDYRMGTIYDGPDPFPFDVSADRERAVYPNNHRAPGDVPPYDFSWVVTGGFSLDDLTPEAPKQRLDGPDGLRFLDKKTGEQIRPSGPVMTIGREPESAIVLDNRYVARRQAALTFEGGFWYIQDCGSTNGTELNGVRLTPGRNYLLRPQDRVLFARCEELLVLSGSSDEQLG